MARLTEAMIKAIMPFAPKVARKASLPILEQVAYQYEITTAPRLRMWLATLAIESGELKYQEEIASGAAYEGRSDLGNTQKGDGRKFKGHGRIQITGREPHTDYTVYLKKSKHLPFIDFVANPHRMAEEPYATDTAGWFVNGFKKLHPLADAGNFLAYQIKVNGRNKKTGKPNHWAERSEYYRRAIMAIPSDFLLVLNPEPLLVSSAQREVLEGQEGWPDFEPVPFDEKDNVDSPNGAGDGDSGSQGGSNLQPIAEGGEEAKNASDGTGIPVGGQSTGQAEGDKEGSPQFVVKERPSLFARVLTAIGGFFAMVIASIATTCGGNEIANTIALKGAERAVENTERNDLYTIGIILLYMILVLGFATAILFIVSKFYGKSSQNAKEVNVAKIDAAKSKTQNTVEFTQNVSSEGKAPTTDSGSVT